MIASQKIFPTNAYAHKRRGLVNRASFALLVSFVVASAFAKSTAPEVTFVSPCECVGFHGKNRWVSKTDLLPVSLDKSAIQISYGVANLRKGKGRGRTWI